jgi:hypothetical protein
MGSKLMAKRIVKKKAPARKAKPKKVEKQQQVIRLGRDNGKAPNLKNPVSQYGYRQAFVPSEYNLVEISLIEDGESYVRQAFQKKTSLMFKEGEVYTGLNEETIAYVKNRIRQIEYVTSIPWRSLLRQTGKELISKSNFFWIKVRKEQHSGGSIGVQRSKPIAGYFPMGAENVYIKKDEYGKVIEYEQRLPNDKIRKFKPEDVIHFRCDVKPGFTFGTPKIVPVIPDIQALRRLEENVEILFYQTLFPVFQYKVGTENKPATTITLSDGTTIDEVSYVRQQIQNMPTEGGIVTPERHEIKYIGANGQIPNYQPVLSYFKSRVLAGLGISSLDIGDSDTANRSTADSLSKALIDSVKDYQAVMEDIVNAQVITELLLEANFSFDPLIEDHFVALKFKEIDIEEQMKKNVNAQLLYNADMIDLNEGREVIGLQPIEKWQEKLMFTERQTLRIMEEQFENDKIIAEISHEQNKETMDIGHEQGLEAAEHEATITPPEEKKSVTTGGGKKTVTVTKKGGNVGAKKAVAASKSAKNKSAPTNQHGTKTGPQKSRLDQLLGIETPTMEFFEKRYGRDSAIYKTNKEAAKQRIIKRLSLTESPDDIRNSVTYLNKYMEII